ncbi:hypothetical protein COOONC_02482 [Cooperia oncophora]
MTTLLLCNCALASVVQTLESGACSYPKIPVEWVSVGKKEFDTMKSDTIQRDPIANNSIVITLLMLEWLAKYFGRGVSLDDTFHTTRYNLRLVTLMVSDEKDRGLPGGSAQVVMNLSSQWNNDKSRCPEVVHGSEEFIAQFFPTTMMTDEARVSQWILCCSPGSAYTALLLQVPYMANVGKENNRACEGLWDSVFGIEKK